MKILHIASVWDNPYNGACVAIPAHIKAQQEKEQVALMNIRDEVITGVNNQFVYKGGSWVNYAPELFKKPDIVVFHEVYHIEFVKIAKQLRYDSIPYVIIPHGSLVDEAQHKKWWKKIVANILYFNKFISSSASIQCLSKNELNNTHFKAPKFTGTNGITIPREQRVNFNVDRVNINYIGRLEVYVKGLDLMMKSFQVLKDELIEKNVHVNLYGPDWQGRYAHVESLISQYDVGGLVTLHHEVSGDDKQKILLDSDIFIQTSRHEGMPMGILEAMGYGIPCLITYGTSLGELINRYNAGWVAETNLESLVETIRFAVRDIASYREKSLNARRLVQENFSWTVIEEATLKTYKLLSSKKRF